MLVKGLHVLLCSAATEYCELYVGISIVMEIKWFLILILQEF